MTIKVVLTHPVKYVVLMLMIVLRKNSEQVTIDNDSTCLSRWAKCLNIYDELLKNNIKRYFYRSTLGK